MTGNPLSIFLMFIFIMIIAFFAIGFADSIGEPTDATALAQYNNLSQVTEISNTGIQSTMLLLIIALVISAMFFVSKMVKK